MEIPLHFINNSTTTITLFLTIVVILAFITRSLRHHDVHLTVTKYNPNHMGAPNCIICIEELSQGQKIRVMPKCKHCFHVECIDLWLQCHSTCPICRTKVIPQTYQQAQQAHTKPLFRFALFVQDFSTKFGYPLDFGIRLDPCGNS
ncbi:hypothetical protein RND81_02G103200 [Saponaria officinalis]|uniref:RING-type E3 ubiquitin transferase n=1 Tax=Saponaria officinalis TaxID=3572 RepID=A0AAW1MPH1_SAPOF